MDSLLYGLFKKEVPLKFVDEKEKVRRDMNYEAAAF